MNRIAHSVYRLLLAGVEGGWAVQRFPGVSPSGSWESRRWRGLGVGAALLLGACTTSSTFLPGAGKDAAQFAADQRACTDEAGNDVRTQHPFTLITGEVVRHDADYFYRICMHDRGNVAADTQLPAPTVSDNNVPAAEALQRAQAASAANDYNGEAYWYLLAGLKGDALAQYRYARIMHFDTRFGPSRMEWPFHGPHDLTRLDPTPPDQDRAIYWATKSAAQGNTDAMSLLVDIYGGYGGSGFAAQHVYPDRTMALSQNPQMAEIWLRRSAAAGPATSGDAVKVRQLDAARAAEAAKQAEAARRQEEARQAEIQRQQDVAAAQRVADAEAKAKAEWDALPEAEKQRRLAEQKLAARASCRSGCQSSKSSCEQENNFHDADTLVAAMSGSWGGMAFHSLMKKDCGQEYKWCLSSCP